MYYESRLRIRLKKASSFRPCVRDCLPNGLEPSLFMLEHLIKDGYVGVQNTLELKKAVSLFIGFSVQNYLI